ncbi:MAG TPA: hypothetical protein VIL86_14890, partial [Tepidisphaeraceae bacterium]
MMQRLNVQGNLGELMLIGGAVALYVATRTAVDAVSRGHPLSPGRKAVGHWLPIAVVALTALILKHPEIAVGLIFATSVASLSLVLGVTRFLAPLAMEPGPARKLWLFVLPAALLVFLSGFGGELNLYHGGILLIEGAVILMLWLGSESAPVGWVGGAYPPTAAPNNTSPASPISPRLAGLAIIEIVLAILLAILGAWSANSGIIRMSQQTRFFSTGLLTAMTLSPLLMLPMVGMELPQPGAPKVADPTTTSVMLVLLNLCLLLPICIGVWYAIPYVARLLPEARIAATRPAVINPSADSTSTTAPTTAPDSTETATVQREGLLYP